MLRRGLVYEKDKLVFMYILLGMHMTPDEDDFVGDD